MFFALPFPPLDPVAFEAGPLVIRWYALAYLAGFVLGWRYCMALARANTQPPMPKDYDDYLTWAVLGTVLGGRIGYVLFYQFGYYLNHPSEALQIWHGGMSFHGGFLGVVLATFVFAHRHKIPFLAFADLIAAAAPIGLFFGRLANFVNGELFGRPTDVPWGIVFPRGGDMPRHPSQLYEAGMEGMLLFLIMFALARQQKIRQHPGTLIGAFLVFYGIFRSLGELFREPDVQIGYLAGGVTMGQILSLPMILAGAALIAWVWRKKPQMS